ncbi:ArsO family NAD(P)H-dependent flavin-containing monooxygenase [Allokutzneria multivorans]|uniref:ArsO family NAD(P)H-dependent flavin-containing monooxygenase n=1 Tax=Allokutzneria multivorans TaxID=1142134 RepID=A0ABP7QXK6_9PSEU
MNSPDALIIGGGQAGLAAAHALRQHGLRPVILEAGAEAVGSWPRYYDSLTLFSPARFSSLPGLAFGGDPERYPHRDEVTDYLRRYATRLDADLRTDHRVSTVEHRAGRFDVTTTSGVELSAPLLIAATGSFNNPHRPALPGLDTFTGTVLHAGDYRAPNSLADKRIVVVGAGNSAVQIAVELAEHAHVTLATRERIRFAPQRPFGRDVHLWAKLTGADSLPIGPWLTNPPGQPVFDTGRYRTAITARRPDRRPMFTRLDGDRVHWSDGTTEPIEVLILATGYHPDLNYLTPLNTLAPSGKPDQRAGLSTTHPGLGYLGLEWQRILASNTLRGVGRDAAHLIPRLLRARARQLGRM